VFGEHGEDVAVVGGCSVALAGDDVVAGVDADLDGHGEALLRGLSLSLSVSNVSVS
jgi:hypothetical protein